MEYATVSSYFYQQLLIHKVLVCHHHLGWYHSLAESPWHHKQGTSDAEVSWQCNVHGSIRGLLKLNMFLAHKLVTENAVCYWKVHLALVGLHWQYLRVQNSYVYTTMCLVSYATSNYFKGAKFLGHKRVRPFKSIQAERHVDVDIVFQSYPC